MIRERIFHKQQDSISQPHSITQKRSSSCQSIWHSITPIIRKITPVDRWYACFVASYGMGRLVNFFIIQPTTFTIRFVSTEFFYWYRSTGGSKGTYVEVKRRNNAIAKFGIELTGVFSLYTCLLVSNISEKLLSCLEFVLLSHLFLLLHLCDL